MGHRKNISPPQNVCYKFKQKIFFMGTAIITYEQFYFTEVFFNESIFLVGKNILLT